MSDIWAKRSTGTSSTTWSKAVNMFVKTASGTSSAAWSTVKNVYVYFSAGWTRVWPLSGVFSLTSPYITTSSGSTTPLYGVDGARRVGGTVYGKNGTWDPNGWVINSYQYRWRAYNSSDINDLNLDSQTSLATYSSAVSLSIPASYDRKYLSFFIQANSSGGSAYNGFAESGVEYGGLQIVRQQPINISASLNNLAPQVNNTISFSSSWNTTDAYAPEAGRTTIQWYKNLNNSTTGGTFRSSGSYSFLVQEEDLNHYIYAVETTFNSGTDYDLGLNTGVSVSRITTSTVIQELVPQPFNTIAFTKGFPSSSSQGVIRSTALSWNASTNATRYEIEYEGSNDNVNWTNVQTFAASPYTTSTSQSAQWGSPQPSGGYPYYYFMRARIRASNTTSSTTVIGDGGAYRYATGSPPGQPSFGSISVTSTTASIPVTASSTQGSNFRYEVMEYQYRTSFTSYPGSWSTQSLSSGSGTISLSGLSASTTYYIKIRNRNFDEEYSAENETNFTTSTALTKLDTPANVNASDNRSDGVNVTWSSVTGAAYYGVWYGPPAPGYDSLADFGGNRNTNLIVHPTTSYLDTSLGTNVTRDYYVQAYRSGDPAGTKSDWGGPDSGTRIAAGTAPSGGSVSLNPSGTQQAGTTITANVSAMSGTATISYVTSIRKKTGSAPTSKTDGTQVASGTGTGNVASHTITASEASGTPDQFRAFTTGTNSFGENIVASNTVISTPAPTAPSTPGTPTLTYVPANNSPSAWGYSASWGASSGSGTIKYQIDAQGISGGTGTLGLYSTNSANFNLNKNNNTWRIRVRATNNEGSTWSGYSDYSTYE